MPIVALSFQGSNVKVLHMLPGYSVIFLGLCNNFAFQKFSLHYYTCFINYPAHLSVLRLAEYESVSTIHCRH